MTEEIKFVICATCGMPYGRDAHGVAHGLAAETEVMRGKMFPDPKRAIWGWYGSEEVDGDYLVLLQPVEWLEDGLVCDSCIRAVKELGEGKVWRWYNDIRREWLAERDKEKKAQKERAASPDYDPLYDPNAPLNRPTEDQMSEGKAVSETLNGALEELLGSDEGE